MNDTSISVLIKGIRTISQELSAMAEALEKEERVGAPTENVAEQDPPAASTERNEACEGQEANEKSVSEAQKEPEMKDAQPSPVANEAPTGEKPNAQEIDKKKLEEIFTQVRGLLAEKARSGKRQQVRDLILSHGRKQLSDFKDKPLVLAALMKEAEEL